LVVGRRVSNGAVRGILKRMMKRIIAEKCLSIYISSIRDNEVLLVRIGLLSWS